MEQIKEFISNPENNIYIHDQTTVLKKISQILLARNKTTVISDFDMTMTKYWKDGKRSMSSHGIMEVYSKMSDTFRKDCKALYDKYYPIEIDHKIPLKDKITHMQDWWTKAHDLIIDLGITKQDIKDMCIENSVVFRSGLHELVENCYKLEIPFLVFSAGIQDIIQQLLEQGQLLKDNMHIISNKLDYDESGKVIGFIGKLIHVFNKNESAVEDGDFKKLLEERDVVIVIGDSLGDLGMSAGIEHSMKLTIGYLNHDQELLMEKYAEAFDVVVLGDSSLGFINLLVELLQNN